AVNSGAQVTILDAMLPVYGGNLFNLEGIFGAIKFIQGDIRDGSLVKSLVREADLIFSLAGQVSYVDSNTDPMLDLDINCKGHLQVLEACREAETRARLVFASSRFVYGKIEYNPVDEGHPFNCLSIYGIHKLAGEKYYHFYQEAYGLETVSVRIANPYGPRQQMKHSKYGIVNWFIRLALEGKPLTIYGEGRQGRDYIFVEDLAEAMLALAQTPGVSGEVFNLGSATSTPFIEMAQMVAEAVPGTQVQQVEWPADRYFVETGDYLSNIDKISRATGWRPRTSLPDGIGRTVAYYKKYRDKYW
ncbi:MAG: NAD-dependent epimerase/dehydratase family protein, partial [Deltaproteobacteria bacterium]|nr:NAD-dependent epimerase/dehydratase family protein [Deltaproteobacteria bacterium]